MASFLSGLLGLEGGKATSKAAGQNVGYLAGLMNRGGNYIKQGQTQGNAALDSAIGAYQPWVDTGTAANTLYGNALGLNGAAGNAAATSAFQTSPGYDFALDQQLQAVERGQAASGMLASGNTLTALQDRAAGVANQEYGSWLERLFGLSGQGLNAASGQAQGYTNKANLAQKVARQRLGFDQDIVSQLMNLTDQNAAGQEMQSAGLAGLGATLGGLAGTAFKGFKGGKF